jgi:hypothetical protein
MPIGAWPECNVLALQAQVRQPAERDFSLLSSTHEEFCLAPRRMPIQ